jgi:hypothetical protein
MLDAHSLPRRCAERDCLKTPDKLRTKVLRAVRTGHRRRMCAVGYQQNVRLRPFSETQEMKANKKRARESSPRPSFARLSPQEEWAFSQVLDPPVQNIGIREYTQGQHSHPRPNWPSLCTMDSAVRGYNTTSNSSHTTIALRIHTTLFAKVRSSAALALGH